MTRTQQLKKIDSTFTLRALKPGKQFISDMCAIPVLPFVPGLGIIHVGVIRHRSRVTTIGVFSSSGKNGIYGMLVMMSSLCYISCRVARFLYKIRFFE